MKKICLFICSLSSGGAEHQCVMLSKILCNKGYDVSIVSFSDIEDHYACDAGVRRIRLALGKKKIIKLFSVVWFFLTAKMDCVISYGQRENLLCIVPLLIRRVKILAGERNYTATCPTLREKVLWNLLYRRADYIVPNSNSQRDYILSKHHHLKGKVISVTNYTDIDEYSYSEYNNHDILRIGIFSRYTAQKNCYRFASAMKLLCDKVGKKRLVVEWYGNQHDTNGRENEEYLQFSNYVHELGISDVLILKDHINNVASILGDFDAICLPSLREGFSNSISEAICCGRPMLVSNVSDNYRMVKDGINGFLFDPMDESSMVQAFEKFRDLSFAERKDMSIASRAVADKLFDKELFGNCYISLINQ